MSSSVSHSKRLLIKGILAGCLLTFSRVGFAATKMVAVRVWPSSTYSRITLESNTFLKFNTFSLSSPLRLVVDIENLTINPVLQTITQKVQSSDPFIKGIRIGQNTPTTVRLVIELKKQVNPSIFALKPIANFNHRLVIDLYPNIDQYSDDPLLALLENFNSGDLNGDTKVAFRQPPKKTSVVVVIDPGHGGEDPGAIGYRGTKEKNIVLQISRRLRDLIKREKGMTVYMTRNEDVFLPLRVRVEKARALHADIFISIHADAFKQRSVRGSSVYMLSTRGASSTAASYLAQTQNEADEIGGVSRSGDPYLDHTILDLTQTTKQTNSRLLGNEILTQMQKVNRLHKKAIETAGFAVLKAPDVASVLVETAFISNLEEEKKLKTAQFQNQIAQSILKGIKAYLPKRKI